MKLALSILIILLSAPRSLIAETDYLKADFNLGYSLNWTPFHYSIFKVSLNDTGAESYLVSILYAQTTRTPSSHRLVDFTAGPFSLSEVTEFKNLNLVEESIQNFYSKLYKSIESRSLFLIERMYMLRAGDASSIKIFKNDSRFFEIWRLWKPHWIYLADLKRLTLEEQEKLFFNEFAIKEWSEY